MRTNNPHFHCGHAAIIGCPNVGKSSLLNTLVGAKLAAVSDKPQTTRFDVHGILTHEKGQMLLYDTPGFHQPQDGLGRMMIHTIKAIIPESDIIIFMTEPRLPLEWEQQVLALLRESTLPSIAVINKIDTLADKKKLLPLMEHYHQTGLFKEIIPLSVMKRDGLELLLETCFQLLPMTDTLLYPENDLSDQTERFMTSEIIREKVFRFTGEEIPYSTEVSIETFTEKEKTLVMSVSLIVNKDSQKGILIGKNGAKIKQIRQAAEKDLSLSFGKPVRLQIWIKVMKNWKKRGTISKEQAPLL